MSQPNKPVVATPFQRALGYTFILSFVVTFALGLSTHVQSVRGFCAVACGFCLACALSVAFWNHEKNNPPTDNNDKDRFL